MANANLCLSNSATISLTSTDPVETLITKDIVVPAHEKGILKKTKVSLTLEEYQMLKLAVPALDNILNFNAYAKHSQTN